MTLEEESFISNMLESNTFEIIGNYGLSIYCSLLYCTDCIHSKQCPSSEIFSEFIETHQELTL